MASIRAAGLRLTEIITNTPHNTDEACAIVRNLISLVEAQQVDFVAALFRAIWGAEPGRLPYLNRPSFFGEILCCWRPAGYRDQGKPNARLGVVRLAKRATARPIFEGSGGQARNHCDRERAEAWRRQRRAAPPILGSDELSNEGHGAIHSSSPLAWQEFGRTRGSRHA